MYSTQTSGDTGREIERRQTSSTVLREEYLPNPGQQDSSVRYVEVPVYEEVIKRIPKQEYIEVEKYVPKYEYEWVDKVVEVPQIHYVDRTVEVQQIQEVVKHIPRREVVDIPKEIIRHVPKIESIVTEKVVEVPGQIIEVPKPFTVENKVPVTHFIDREVPMVVSQTIRPVISESSQSVEVDTWEYEPEIVVVDVHVPKPIPSQLIPAGLIEEVHSVVTVPAAQYNSMLKVLNGHISEGDQHSALPFLTENGAIPMLSGFDSSMMYQAPITTAQIHGFVPRQTVTTTTVSDNFDIPSQPSYPNVSNAGDDGRGTERSHKKSYHSRSAHRSQSSQHRDSSRKHRS